MTSVDADRVAAIYLDSLPHSRLFPPGAPVGPENG